MLCAQTPIIHLPTVVVAFQKKNIYANQVVISQAYIQQYGAQTITQVLQNIAGV